MAIWQPCLVVVEDHLWRQRQLGDVRRQAGLPHLGRSVDVGPATKKEKVKSESVPKIIANNFHVSIN